MEHSAFALGTTLTRSNQVAAAIIHLPSGRMMHWVDKTEPTDQVTQLRDLARTNPDWKFIEPRLLDPYTFYSVLAMLPEGATMHPLRYLYHARQVQGVTSRLQMLMAQQADLQALSQQGTQDGTLDNNVRFRAEIRSECARLQIEIDVTEQQLDTLKSLAQTDFILANLS